MPQTRSQNSRRGRPRTGERATRQEAVLEAAMAELLDSGFDKVTMLSVAKRAGASKETLYSWFGNRDGLFAALIERNGDAAASAVAKALSSDEPPTEVLTKFVIGLVSLLTGERSIALNRAAISSPPLAGLLLAGGRHRVGPIVETYLQHLHQGGHLKEPDATTAFRLLYGLAIEDTQIRVLLGEQAPSAKEIRRRAPLAVERFFQLTS